MGAVRTAIIVGFAHKNAPAQRCAGGNHHALAAVIAAQRRYYPAHTLALFYPFASVEAGTVTRLSVRLVCAGGTVKIAPYGIKATVTGQGMASETPWDGTLECEETLLPIAIKTRSIDV